MGDAGLNAGPLFQKLDTILIVDTETTGLPDNPNARTIEIAAVWWSIERGCVLATWSELVQQDSNEAERVNRIPAPALRLGLPPAHAAEGFLSRVARADVLVAHRAEFDRQFLPKVDKPWVCTKFHFSWDHGDPGESLVPLAIAHGVAVTHAHRALTDCMLLARLFETLSAAVVRHRLREAIRPRKRYRALVSFDQKDLAKERGFRWVPETKEWVRDMAVDDAERPFPFRIVEIKAEPEDANDGRRWRQ